jgi:hypothetical protein
MKITETKPGGGMKNRNDGDRNGIRILSLGLAKRPLFYLHAHTFLIFSPSHFEKREAVVWVL